MEHVSRMAPDLSRVQLKWHYYKTQKRQATHLPVMLPLPVEHVCRCMPIMVLTQWLDLLHLFVNGTSGGDASQQSRSLPRTQALRVSYSQQAFLPRHHDERGAQGLGRFLSQNRGKRLHFSDTPCPVPCK